MHRHSAPLMIYPSQAKTRERDRETDRQTKREREREREMLSLEASLATVVAVGHTHVKVMMYVLSYIIICLSLTLPSSMSTSEALSVPSPSDPLKSENMPRAVRGLSTPGWGAWLGPRNVSESMMSWREAERCFLSMITLSSIWPSLAYSVCISMCAVYHRVTFLCMWQTCGF